MCLRAHVDVQCKLEEGTGCLGAGIAGSFKLSDLGAGVLADFLLLWTRPLQ